MDERDVMLRLSLWRVRGKYTIIIDPQKQLTSVLLVCHTQSHIIVEVDINLIETNYNRPVHVFRSSRKISQLNTNLVLRSRLHNFTIILKSCGAPKRQA